jgi:hypothetical protein
MNEYVTIRPAGKEYQIWFHIGNQEFPVGVPFDTFPEADWYKSMFEIALDRFLKENSVEGSQG